VRVGRLWFALLLSLICFEGLGRRYVPGLPQAAWYFSKDVLLVIGAMAFGIGGPTGRTVRALYRGFLPWMALAMAWTILEVANPSQASFSLAVLGLRSYWLWWMAPAVLARALPQESDRNFAVRFLAGVALVVAAFAAFQFSAGADAEVNQYVWGGDQMEVALAAATGRVRVSSTFAYLTGFTDFATISITLLIGLGLTAAGRTRLFAFAAAATMAAVLPMSASRAPVLVCLGSAALIVWVSDVVRTRRGRIALAAVTLVASAGVMWSGEAVEGLRERFTYDDTDSRVWEILDILPPVAMARSEYPVLGIGTGMQQNARISLGVTSEWNTEGETGRILIELGAPGYLLVWLARLGLSVALLRGYLLLRSAGRKPAAGICLALAVLTQLGALTIDHVWQALYFLALGLILPMISAARAESRELAVPAAQRLREAVP
jgi:hypothetical protein